MDAVALQAILSEAAESRPRLGFGDLSSTEIGPLPSDAALARLLMIQLSDAPDESLVAPCANAIASLQNWRDLLWELLANVPPSDRTVRVMAGVLAVQAPDHPISNLVACVKLAAWNAFDAVDDGVLVRLKLDASSLLLGMSEGHFVSINDPVNVWAGCAVVRREGDVLWLRVIRDSELFANRRAVIPPAVLVAAIN